MKKLFFTVFLFILFCANAFAYDVHDWNLYVGANAGITASDVTVHDEDFFDFGGVYNFEFGARYNKRYRVALNYQSRAEVSELFQILLGHMISVSNNALRINGYYDYLSYNKFAMYIGIGLGGNWYDYTITDRATDSSESRHGMTFTAGAMTGLSFGIGRANLDLGFAFDYIADPRIFGYGPNIGLRYNF